PTGVAIAGNDLFVADTGNNTIREIELDSGEVATLAGTPDPVGGSADGICDLASFRSPGGLAADGAGNLYVADTGNDTIRKIEIATEKVTTSAGVVGVRGIAGGIGTRATFNSPGGIAWDGAGSLLVADTGNRSIRQIEIATADVVGVGGVVAGACQ